LSAKNVEHKFIAPNSVEIRDYQINLANQAKNEMFANTNKILTTMIQKSTSNITANLLISTHIAIERDIQNMIKELENLDFVNSKPVMIRIV
jgi:ERCC4-related helicase